MTETKGKAATASAGQVYRNGAMAVVIAWSMRLIGLVSVFVLARTLTPADFGIVALAMATLAMIDVFSALGLRQALLRVREPDRGHYDTVWTIQLLVLVFLSLVVAALGPVMAWFYKEPALTWVIAILATRFVMFGLTNIGIVDFERNLELGRDLKFRVTVRLSAFVVTVSAALLLQNYWALVIGSVFQGLAHCTLSYVAHPYRPRFSLARRAEMLNVSIWMFLASAAQTVHTETERIVIGRISSFGVLGHYSVSKGLSSIFTEEIATALNRVTFVTTARTGESLGAAPARLRAMLGTYALIAAPLGLGLAASADNAVIVLLGEGWGQAAQFLKFIAPAAALYAVFKLIISSFQASGKAKLAALLAMGSAGAVVTSIGIVVASLGDALAVARGILFASVAVLTVGVIVMSRIEHTSLYRLLLAVARPFAAAAIMYVVVMITPQIGPPLLSLAGQVAIGAIAYLLAVGALWTISGRPDGAEANLSIELASYWHSRRRDGTRML